MAEEVTSLRLSIDSTSAVKAEKDLNNLSKESDKLEKNVKKSTDNMANSFGFLKTAIAGVSLSYMVAEYVKFADQMITIDSRIKLVTKSIDEQTKAHKELFNIAQQTRLGFKETADLYSRIAISTKDYNFSQEKILSITNTINKAMIISGGTAESMNSAIIQLGQAFSGNFQSVGQELASIREQTPALYQAIVAGSGMTSKAFKQAAEDGELSAEIIIKALEKQANAIDIDFSKMNKTVGQSMTQMTNSIMGLIGEIDKSTGASSSLSNIITKMSMDMDNFTKSLQGSNNILDDLSKKANIKLESDGLLGSILKANQGAGEELYKVLAETLKIVDRTAGEWSKIIDSSYSGMGKWVESVGGSLGIVEEKAKLTKKAIDSIVPSRPSADSYTLVEDLDDRFTRSTEASKKNWEKRYDVDKKAYDEQLRLQKKSQNEAETLSEQWAKRKIDISSNTMEAEQEAFAKPYIELEEKYKEDLEKFGKIQGAKKFLLEEYEATVQGLNNKTVEKFNKKEEEKYKKAVEWQIKIFEANEKLNEQLLAQQIKMYGEDNYVTIENWYQNQLEWLGKLSLEGKATSKDLEELLSKIDEIKNLKLKEQTLSFKLEKTFFNSFEDNLSDAIENGFNKTTLKSFFKNIEKDLLRTFSNSMSGGITNMLRGTSSNYATGLSMLTGGAGLVGSAVSASDIAGIMNSGGKFDSATNSVMTAGGTNLSLNASGGGTVSKTGSDIMSLVNTTSTLKTAYTALTGGISSSIMNGFNGIADIFASNGMWGASTGISNFGYGVANPFSYGAGSSAFGSTTAGGALGGGLLGGAVGYGVGSLGDKLFGADTKAGIGGALGGATGGVLASLGVLGGLPGIIGGSLLGSLLGGMFGTKKTTDTGYQFMDTASADNVNAVGYSDWKKKSWFSSSKGTNFTGLTEKEKKQISTMFETYDYLLVQLGDNDKVFLDAGKYTGTTFADQITKNFITAFTDVNQNLDSSIYNSWVDYATSINKTVQEAMATSVATFIQSKRTFEVWSLGDSVEALAKKAQFAKDDLAQLESMVGVTGITVDNFLDRYNKAVKEGFTPETLSNWENLSTALMSATDAQKAYADTVKAQNEAIRQNALTLLNSQLSAWITTLGAVQGAIDNLNPSFKTFAELASSTITLDNYSTLLSELEKTRQNEISKLTDASNIRITQLQKEKSYFEDILNYVEDLTRRMTTQTSTLGTFFYNELQQAKDNFAKGTNVNISDLSSSATSYLDSVKENSATQRDYFFEVAKVRNELSDFGTSLAEGGSLEGIEAAIASEEATLAFKLDKLNQTALDILNGYKSTATTNVNTATDKYNAINNDVVSKAYSEVLGRTADTAGYAYWSDEIAKGNINANNIKEAIANAALAFNTATYTGNVSSSTMEQSVENAKKYLGFTNGGYTGSMGVNDIAGVVHGQEYVIDAPTTRDLGLNNSGGVFKSMLTEIRSLKAENSSVRQLMVKLVADNSKQLSTQRAILGGGVL